MGALLGFFVGWAVGSKAGPKRFQEVVSAAREVQQSEEFGALVQISRAHLASALQELSRLVSATEEPGPDDLVNRVRRMSSLRVM
jgi:hypothetical protein